MPRSNPIRRVARFRTTLFELVSAVAESASNDEETVAVVTHWLGRGAPRAPRCGGRSGAKEDTICSQSFA